MPETAICQRCNLAHPPTEIPDSLSDVNEKHVLQLEDCLRYQRGAMLWLLEHAGKKGTCTGPNCGAPGYWVTHTNGKHVLYTEAGLNHFIDCVDRDRFKRAK